MKYFPVAVVVGVLALGFFAYFIFGLNDKPSTTTAQTTVSPTTDPTGLKIEDTVVGTGREVKKGDIAVVHYKGLLTNGKQFDSSYDRNEPFESVIGAGILIKGWDIGLIGMKVGGKRKLTIPPSLAYGEQSSETIPPNSTLIFELELLDVK